MRITHAALAAVAAGAIALAVGCGGSSSSSSTTKTTTTPNAAATKPSASSGGGQTLKLSADPSGALKFTTTSLTAKTGRVTLVMHNPSAVPHSIAVEGHGVDRDAPRTADKGGTSTVTVSLTKPGTYEFYCPVDGHKAAGMKGTLVVK